MGIPKDNFFKNFILGVTNECIQVDSRKLNTDAILKLVSSAKKQVAIISRQLDATIFNTEDFIQLASQLARLDKYSNIKILVHDTDSMIKNGHRILELSQRISSKVKIRTICNEYSQFNQSFLVADNTGFIHNLKSDLYNAEVNFNDTDKSKELAEYFKNIWELSKQDAAVRRLCM